jgi:hypothetical protein
MFFRPYITSRHVTSRHISHITYHRSRIVSYRIVTHRIASHRIVSYRIVSYRILSYRIISYHIISYHIISYHIISYHIRRSQTEETQINSLQHPRWHLNNKPRRHTTDTKPRPRTDQRRHWSQIRLHNKEQDQELGHWSGGKGQEVAVTFEDKIRVAFMQSRRLCSSNEMFQVLKVQP